MTESDVEMAASGAETVESKFKKLDIDDSAAEAPAKVESEPSISFSIWPPSDRTRKEVLSSLIENLTTPSPISNLYGTLSTEEAEVLAKQVEEESFAVAGCDKKVDDDDIIEVLEVYADEINERMVEVLEARAGRNAFWTKLAELIKYCSDEIIHDNADMEKEGCVNEKVEWFATEEVES